jgi:putative endonuclease
MPEWYVYIIRCSDESLYTGITTDVARRFAEHQANGRGGSKYLRGRAPLNLVLQTRIGDKGLALKVENRIKKLLRREKEELIKSVSGVADLLKQIDP